jgi:sialate O-acetylesterase
MRYFIIILFLFPHVLIAQFKVADPFSDHMVLQKGKPIVVWGTGVPNTKLVCYLGTEVKNTTVTPEGQWRLQFASRVQSEQPIELKIEADGLVKKFTDILIGDVWLCIGQSNMEWPMRNEKHWSQFSSSLTHHLIRFANPPPAGRNIFNQSFNDSLISRLSNSSFYQWSQWQVASLSTLSNMSAVAFYFADAITKKVTVPTGLINLSIGGAPLETFIDANALKNSAQFSHKVKGDWRYNDSLPEWIRLRGRQNLDTINPVYKDELGPNHAFKPGFAFSSGVYALKDLPIAGILVYQGESNAEESRSVVEYGALSQVMVNSYRALWDNRQLPVYWVQLSSIQREHWPWFRDEQRKLLNEINYSGMVVTTDIGHPTDVHPRDKKTVGERLSRWALRDLYQQKIEVSGPLPNRVKYKKGKLTITFNHANQLQTSDGKELKEFSFDGINEVTCFLEKNKVVIYTKVKPEYIYYGWRPYSKSNLVNEALLPASTFKMKVH